MIGSTGRWRLTGLACALVLFRLPCLSGERPLALELRGSYTTTSKIFFNPDALSAFERNQSFSVDDVLGFGLDVRRIIGYQLRVGISLEIITASTPSRRWIRDRSGQLFLLDVEDGYWMIPLELSGYFTVPFSGERTKVYMGGGVGLYFGERTIEAGGVKTETLEREVGVGIHVASGVDYFITSALSVRGELKFRDPQFESTSRFPAEPIAHDGGFLIPDQEPFRSRVNIDGLTVNLGVILHI